MQTNARADTTARLDGTRRSRGGGRHVGAARLDRRFRIGIVGGGASGTLLATRLLSAAPSGVEIVVIEPRPALGQGVAYGTDDPWHRLNVPARDDQRAPGGPGPVPALGRRPGRRVRPAAQVRGVPGRPPGHRAAPARRPGSTTCGPPRPRSRPTVEGLAISLDGAPALVVDAAVLATGVGAAVAAGLPRGRRRRPARHPQPVGAPRARRDPRRRRGRGRGHRADGRRRRRDRCSPGTGRRA